MYSEIKDGARSVWYGGRLITVLATSAETAGHHAVVEVQARRADTVEMPLHIQTRASMCCYVADGELAVELGDRVLELAPGGSVLIPSGTPHRLIARSEWVRLISIYAPGGFEGFFGEVGEPAESWTARVHPPVDVERLVTVAAKYGVEIVAPPM